MEIQFPIKTFLQENFANMLLSFNGSNVAIHSFSGFHFFRFQTTSSILSNSTTISNHFRLGRGVSRKCSQQHSSCYSREGCTSPQLFNLMPIEKANSHAAFKDQQQCQSCQIILQSPVDLEAQAIFWTSSK